METMLMTADETTISLAADLWRKGQLVAFPTETVYGLGANALDEDAVKSIFKAKGRPQDNPLIVHIARREQMDDLCIVSPMAEKLMEAFWPGPLTLLLPKKSVIPNVVTASLPSVGMRMPSHPVARALLLKCGLPIAAPSANRSGKPSPTLAQHVWEDMEGRIPLIVNGGACQVGVESTVLDMTSNPPCILRPGGVTPEMLLTVLPQVTVAGSVLRPLHVDEPALSPGMRYKHYAPKGALTLVMGTDENVLPLMKKKYGEAIAKGKTACLLAFDDCLPALAGCHTLSLGQLTHPEEMANRLFDLLRRMDQENIDVIYSQVVPAQGVGLAIMNRLGRAAAFHTLDANEMEKESP